MNLLDVLVEWFLNSPIYKNEAYVAYYSTNKEGPVYPEITAYAISLCCILYERRREPILLERAETCAKHLKKINKNGAVPCFTDNLLYAFDTGIYISSMFDLYALTKEATYLEEAEKSLNWLLSLWDGKQFAAVNKIPEKNDWYHQPSVHLVKLVLPLMKATTCLRDEKYSKTALELLERYKHLQTGEGGFQINESSRVIMTHPHCYATEGFLYAYHISKKNKFLEIARKSSDWLCKAQNLDGSFYRCYNLGEKTEKRWRQEMLKTSDATAQAIRIWKLLGVNQKGIEKAYKYLGSELKDNGLRLLKNDSLKSKLFSWRREIYSWPTFFYIHSLLLPFGQIQYCKELF